MKKLFIVVPTVDENDKDYEKYLKPSIPKHLLKNTYCIDNSKGNSMFAKYNYAIDYLTKRRKLDDEDMVIFCHSDVTIIDPLFEAKLKMTFDFDKTIGMVGVIGTTIFTEGGGWWLVNRNEFTRGNIIQGLSDGSTYHMIEKGGGHGFFDVCSVDGCFFCLSGKLLNNYRFDTQHFDDYHFYDVDTAFSVQELGYKVKVADILIKHESEGPLSEKWSDQKNKFISKWNSKGYNFPINISSFKR